MGRTQNKLTCAPTLPSHSHLEAFLESAVLALIPVMLVNRTVPVSSASVSEVPPDTSLEEGLAPFTRELTVVFSAAFITANYTLYVLLILVRTGRCARLGWRHGTTAAVLGPR